MVRQIVKIFLGKTVFWKEPGRAAFFWAQKQRTGGGKRWTVVVLTRQKNSFKSHFFYMINELFYCIKNPEKQSSLHKFHKFHKFHKKSRVDLTGELQTVRRCVWVHITKEVFSCSIFCLTYGSGTSTMYEVCTDLGIVLLVVYQPLPNLLIFWTMTLSSEFA